MPGLIDQAPVQAQTLISLIPGPAPGEAGLLHTDPASLNALLGHTTADLPVVTPAAFMTPIEQVTSPKSYVYPHACFMTSVSFCFSTNPVAFSHPQHCHNQYNSIVCIQASTDTKSATKSATKSVARDLKRGNQALVHIGFETDEDDAAEVNSPDKRVKAADAGTSAPKATKHGKPRYSAKDKHVFSESSLICIQSNMQQPL
jgi:hypothetical protein